MRSSLALLALLLLLAAAVRSAMGEAPTLTQPDHSAMALFTFAILAFRAPRL